MQSAAASAVGWSVAEYGQEWARRPDSRNTLAAGLPGGESGGVRRIRPLPRPEGVPQRRSSSLHSLGALQEAGQDVGTALTAEEMRSSLEPLLEEIRLMRQAIDQRRAGTTESDCAPADIPARSSSIISASSQSSLLPGQLHVRDGKPAAPPAAERALVSCCLRVAGPSWRSRALLNGANRRKFALGIVSRADHSGPR